MTPPTQLFSEHSSEAALAPPCAAGNYKVYAWLFYSDCHGYLEPVEDVDTIIADVPYFDRCGSVSCVCCLCGSSEGFSLLGLNARVSQGPRQIATLDLVDKQGAAFVSRMDGVGGWAGWTEWADWRDGGGCAGGPRGSGALEDVMTATAVMQLWQVHAQRAGSGIMGAGSCCVSAVKADTPHHHRFIPSFFKIVGMPHRQCFKLTFFQTVGTPHRQRFIPSWLSRRLGYPDARGSHKESPHNISASIASATGRSCLPPALCQAL
eukprot:311583-Chlamydomonas_euryale.AAC.8